MTGRSWPYCADQGTASFDPPYALQEPSTVASPGARSWARLIARIYEVDPIQLVYGVGYQNALARRE